MLPSNTPSSVLGQIIDVQIDGFDQAVANLTVGLDAVDAVRKVMRKYSVIAQAEAVKNVSGNVVTYSGGSFTINRDTGNLAQSMQRTTPNALSFVILNSANYARDVHDGVLHPVDMKPFLMGKTIPIKVGGPQGDPHLPFPVMTSFKDGAFSGNSHRGKTPTKVVAMKNGKGAITGYQFIIFRKVTAKSHGWIIPPRPARPFLTAMAEKVQPMLEAELAATWALFVGGGKP